VAQRQIKMPVKDKAVPRKESSEEAPSQRKQTEEGRYLLQVDRQTKGSFSTFEAAQSAAVQIKTGFPILQVSIYDSVSKSRTPVDLAGTVVIRAVTSPGHSYGGYKESGIGREFSLEGLLESYTQRKNVTVNLTH
jgi:hypothetical protein